MPPLRARVRRKKWMELQPRQQEMVVEMVANLVALQLQLLLDLLKMVLHLHPLLHLQLSLLQPQPEKNLQKHRQM